MKAHILIPVSVLLLSVGGVLFLVNGFTDKNSSQQAVSGLPELTNAPPSASTPQPERQGAFTKVSEKYSVSGKVTVVQRDGKSILRIDDSFTISFGPDLYIHFGSKGAYTDAARVARLNKLAGSQEYEIPDAINPDEYDEVWIWCRAFSEPFAVAKLEN